MKKLSPFEIENLRARLASKKDYSALLKTYTKSYPEIKDQNTSILWDNLNIQGRIENTANPMEDDRIKKSAALISGKNIAVLNIGFGSANLEKEYFKNNNYNNINWIGIDISPQSVIKAKKEFPFATFKVGDMSKLDWPKHTFDYVTSLEVLEHIPPSKIMRCLKEIYRVIKPGGYFVVSVPLNEGLEDMIARGENPNAHVRTYTPDVIKAELQISGFTILREQKLYAFNKLYKLKSFIANHVLKSKFHFNNIILLSQKPFN